MTKISLFDTRIWKLCCSLKLAIVLASAATLLAVGGSVLMPFNSQLFGSLDSMPLGLWLKQVATRQLTLTWWIPVGGILVTLLAVNSLCCFIDWLRVIKSRWRKGGEYLIHLGFVLILVAFWWGSQAGIRSENNTLLVGQSIPLSKLGVRLTLEGFAPVLAPSGRPMEMLTTLALYRGEELVKRVQTRSNEPLLWEGLVVIPTSYGQTLRGGSPIPYSILTINYDPGARLAFAGSLAMGCGVLLTLVSFYRKRAHGDRPEIV
ncbi:MAG: cytochrome c biogenesis protein ResB [Deltaproteobacteria bacterium]|nr:cytochrome c biogenesis protein ResB [Deltaproteobacteria bacterium]NCP04463.1 cytochrome c biogenesis protein ResB [Deltaproteobacteria bacterium]